MKYRTLGRSGFEVSEVGFGCGRTGGILLNATLDERRSAMQKALDGGINWFDTAEAYGSEPALGMDLEQALTRLPDGARQVFVLHDVEGYRHEEIATMLGLAEGTSKSQLHRARMALRKHLTN